MLNAGGSAKAAVAPRPGRLSRAIRAEWLGQTAASLCWMGSVLVDGIDSGSDWLQLAAAASWLLANVATVVAKPN